MKKIAIVFVAVFYCLLPNVTKAQRTCTDGELSFTITHPDVLCEGAETTAMVNIEYHNVDNTDLWYEWSDGSITQSIQISEAGIYSVTVTDTYNACSKSDSIEIIQSQYTVPDISVHQCGATGNQVNICGTSVNLCVEIGSAGNIDYMWQCNDIEGSFDDPTNTNPTFTLSPDVQISRYRDADFLFTATNEECSATDTMHVRFLQKPVANAGIDHVACENRYELNGVWSLQPADNYTPTCQWTVGDMPRPDAQVTWTNSPHDSIVEGVQVSDYGVYTFIIRENNTAGDVTTCFDRDTVTIEFMEPPNARAGEDFNVCGLDFQLNAVSSHDEDDNISGIWTSISGGTTSFTDSTDPHTTGHYSAYGAVIFRWTETNQPSIEIDDVETCSAFDEVVVTFYEIPSAVISMNEADTVVCGLVTPFLLRAEEPGDNISGYWYEENLSTQFGENNQTVNSIYTDARVSSYGRHDFYWIEYIGSSDNPRFCIDTAGPWTINFIQPAEILEDQFKSCTSDGQLSAVPTESGEGTWSSSIPDVISFDEPNNPSTAVHTTILNNENLPYTIYWTVRDESCLTKDSIEATFGDVPKHFIDTTVSNFVTIGDHTFYSSGNYTFSMPSETGCDTIYNIHLRVLAEPVYDIGPNPTSKMLNINSDGFISTVEFYSTTGQLVMRKEVNGYDAMFDMEGLVDGVYILRIYGEESSLPSVSKIVKE